MKPTSSFFKVNFPSLPSSFCLIYIIYFNITNYLGVTEQDVMKEHIQNPLVTIKTLLKKLRKVM